jgi:tetratricopeptide (TPR) repeat protein
VIDLTSLRARLLTMPPEDFIDTRLEMLRRRWSEDPSPHLSLQLADLYRQQGEVAEGVTVLERGLEKNPGHTSVQVALGRYRLEAGDPGAAEVVLREVVSGDPGHLVANKLLVRAYLALDDSQRAGDRLELYAVLNDSDPELATLRAAVAGEFKPVAPRPAGPTIRALTGALDSEPFAALLATPLESVPLVELFPREAGGDAQPAEEPLPAMAVEDAPEAFTSQVPEREQRDAETDDEAPVLQEIDAGSAATATLGALYLAQDHLEDAQATFEQVLDRDPEDAEALAGLRELERRRSRKEPAEGVARFGENGPKIEALQRYLGRIRAAADRLSA